MSARTNEIRWNTRKIVAALLDRQARGLELNTGAIQKSDIPLAGAIQRHFGLHDEALRAAGIEPDTIRQRDHPWDRERVVAALHERRARAEALNAGAIQASQPALGSAIHAHFPSHDAALRAAGVDPAVARKHFHWDKARVIAALAERRDRDMAMYIRAIEKSDPSLVGAIRRNFGSHDAALSAAGIDPASVRKKLPLLDEAEIIALLRTMARDGEVSHGLAESAAGRRLVRSAERRFGSLEAAVEAAGLRYVRRPGTIGRRLGHWKEETILHTLRALHEGGHDLRYSPMKRHSQPLFFAAKQFFGSYVNAVRQAGIDYWQMSQAQLSRERADVK